MKNTDEQNIFKASNLGANMVLTMGIILLVFSIYISPKLIADHYYDLRTYIVIPIAFVFSIVSVYGGLFKMRNQNILIINKSKLIYYPLSLKPIEIPFSEINTIVKKTENEFQIQYIESLSKEPLLLEVKWIKKDQRNDAVKQLENIVNPNI